VVKEAGVAHPPLRDPALSTATVHLYVSTYCQHELHGDCRLACKHCHASCLCPCHAMPDQDDDNNEEDDG